MSDVLVRCPDCAELALDLRSGVCDVCDDPEYGPGKPSTLEGFGVSQAKGDMRSRFIDPEYGPGKGSVLKPLGIAKVTAHRWQRLFDIPEDDSETAHIAEDAPHATFSDWVGRLCTDNAHPAWLVVVLVCLLVAIAIDVPAAVVFEDSPGWDCRTMGNQLCGPGSGFSVAGSVVRYFGGSVAL